MAYDTRCPRADEHTIAEIRRLTSETTKTQKQIADQLGVSQSTVSRRARDIAKRDATLDRFAEQFDTLLWLLEKHGLIGDFYALAEALGERSGDEYLTEQIFDLGERERDLRWRRASARLTEEKGGFSHRLPDFCPACNRPHDQHERRPADERS